MGADQQPDEAQAVKPGNESSKAKRRGPMDEMRQLMRILTKLLPQSVKHMGLTFDPQAANCCTEDHVKEYVRKVLGSEAPEVPWGVPRGWASYVAELLTWALGRDVYETDVRNLLIRPRGCRWQLKAEMALEMGLFAYAWPLPPTRKGIERAQAKPGNPPTGSGYLPPPPGWPDVELPFWAPERRPQNSEKLEQQDKQEKEQTGASAPGQDAPTISSRALDQVPLMLLSEPQLLNLMTTLCQAVLVKTQGEDRVTYTPEQHESLSQHYDFLMSLLMTARSQHQVSPTTGSVVYDPNADEAMDAQQHLQQDRVSDPAYQHVVSDEYHTGQVAALQDVYQYVPERPPAMAQQQAVQYVGKPAVPSTAQHPAAVQHPDSKAARVDETSSTGQPVYLTVEAQAVPGSTSHKRAGGSELAEDGEQPGRTSRNAKRSKAAKDVCDARGGQINRVKQSRAGNSHDSRQQRKRTKQHAYSELAARVHELASRLGEKPKQQTHMESKPTADDSKQSKRSVGNGERMHVEQHGTLVDASPSRQVKSSGQRAAVLMMPETEHGGLMPFEAAPDADPASDLLLFHRPPTSPAVRLLSGHVMSHRGPQHVPGPCVAEASMVHAVLPVQGSPVPALQYMPSSVLPGDNRHMLHAVPSPHRAYPHCAAGYE